LFIFGGFFVVPLKHLLTLAGGAAGKEQHHYEDPEEAAQADPEKEVNDK
jgi:hypothetical protein